MAIASASRSRSPNSEAVADAGEEVDADAVAEGVRGRERSLDDVGSTVELPPALSLPPPPVLTAVHV